MLNKKISPFEKKLRDFAADLIKEKKLVIEDEEIRQGLVDDLYDRLEERVNAVILSSIPPEKLEDFDKLLDTGSPEQISDFCFTNIPDLQNILTNALGSFRLTYLGL